MIPCTTCNRHYRVDDAACPFCAKPSGAKRAMQSLGAAFTTLVLAACYGGDDLGKYDSNWDSGTGDTSLPTTGETTEDTGTSDTSTSDTGLTTSDTGLTTSDTGLTTSTEDTGTDDTATTGSTTDSGTTSTFTTTTTDSGTEVASTNSDTGF